MQRQYHPDKFASGTEAQQLAAVQQSRHTISGHGKRCVTRALTRAEYLLSLTRVRSGSEAAYGTRHRVF